MEAAMSKRILGNVPIFAKDSAFGSLHDTTGKAFRSGSLGFYSNNMVGYEKGITKVTPEIFNGALNYVTELLNYSFAMGVPEFSLNVAYAKGAVVTFDGALYISKTDDNVTHVSQASHWAKIAVEPQNNGSCTSKTDSNPIGTILTVPVTAELDGYIDYVEGKTFNPTIYPELYKALGTKQFTGTNSGTDNLPVGTVLPLLSSTGNIPAGYIEWTTNYGLLSKYPELLKVLTDMVNQLPLGDSKTAWLEALRTHSLPMFESAGFFLGYGKQVGTYTTDSTRTQTVQFAPVVVDASNTLNPLGYNRCAESKETVAPVNANNVSRSPSESPFVMLANRAGVHQDVQNKTMYQVALGDGNETAPRHLAVRLLIKAVSSQPASISATHKQIIKAF